MEKEKEKKDKGKSKGTCHGCGKEGHHKWQCPEGKGAKGKGKSSFMWGPAKGTIRSLDSAQPFGYFGAVQSVEPIEKKIDESPALYPRTMPENQRIGGAKYFKFSTTPEEEEPQSPTPKVETPEPLTPKVETPKPKVETPATPTPTVETPKPFQFQENDDLYSEKKRNQKAFEKQKTSNSKYKKQQTPRRKTKEHK